MRIIQRSEWGARYGDGVGWAQFPATEMYLHHSVTLAPDMVLPRDDDYAAIRRLDEIGRERFGDSYGFPYTFGITPAGLIFKGHHIRKMGAHTYGHNDTARAICWVGNYEEDQPTDAQIEATAWLLRHGRAEGWWTQAALTGGHRDVYATACPGIHAYNAIEEINQLAAREPIEEDDMPDRDTFEQWVHNGVLQAAMDPNVRAQLNIGTWHEATVHRGEREIPTLQELADAKTQALAAVAGVNGLATAIEALSDDSTLTADRVEQIVRDAVQQSIEISGTVTVTGQEGNAS